MRLDVLLFTDEDPKYNRDAEILAQFLNKLREMYPDLIINEYDADKVEGLTSQLSQLNLDKKYPVFLYNNQVLVSDGIPTIEDMEQIINNN